MIYLIYKTNLFNTKECKILLINETNTIILKFDMQFYPSTEFRIIAMYLFERNKLPAYTLVMVGYGICP